MINGQVKSAQQIAQQLYDTINRLCPNENDFRTWWQSPTKRKQFLDRLQQQHFETALLQDIKKSLTDKDIDIFDMLIHIAFQSDMHTKSDRTAHSKHHINETGEIRQFLEFLLDEYEKSDQDIFNPDVSGLLELKYKTVLDGLNTLGNTTDIQTLIAKMQHHIYDI